MTLFNTIKIDMRTTSRHRAIYDAFCLLNFPIRREVAKKTPIDPFTTLELQNPSYDVPGVHKIQSLLNLRL